MFNVGYDTLGWYLGVVGMGVVDGAVLAGLDRLGKGWPAIGVAFRIVGRAMILDELRSNNVVLKIIEQSY